MNNNEQSSKNTSKVITEISSPNAIADYLQNVGFFLSLVDTRHYRKLYRTNPGA